MSISTNDGIIDLQKRKECLKYPVTDSATFSTAN